MSNAAFTVDGAGAYAVSLTGDDSSGTLDFDFQSNIRTPQRREPERGGPAHLKPTAIAPCKD